MSNQLAEKIRELKALIQQEFPEGGVSIAIVGESYNAQPVKKVEPPATTEHKPTEYAQTIDEKPPIIPIDQQANSIDDIKKLLNAYAQKHGVEAAFGLVEKLTGGSKNPADIPKDKWSYVVQAAMVEGVRNE